MFNILFSHILSGRQILKFPGNFNVKKCYNFTTNKNSLLKFIVDPLDGTTNYTNNWPHTVSIGVVNNDQLIVGIIYDALSNKVYTGVHNQGVFESNIDNILEFKCVYEPIYSNNKQIKKSVVSYDTPYRKESYEITKELCSLLYEVGASLKTVGPISLDILKTALGKENRPNDYNDAVWHCEVRA